jgi:hypothetical protein
LGIMHRIVPKSSRIAELNLALAAD